ncbi:MAG: PIN domain-containing protein [Candidatus Sulfotelmatobacter sp.]
MTALVFVDSNVLIYAMDEGNPKKHEAAKLWRSELWKSRRGRVSFQVLQEFYANIARRWPEASEQARAEIRNLLAWKPVVMNAEILEHGWKVQDRYKLSFWDSLIVAAAKAASCRFLLTEDLQADQDFDGVVVLNPFRRGPSEISST